MKIKKQATSRHESTLSPMIADFVKATALIPLFQIPAHLASFPKQWPFPRGDTYHWIPALNRFDRILELFNQEYGLIDGPQTQPFQRRLLLKGDAEDDKTAVEHATSDAILDNLHIPQDGDRELIEQILNFTRLLLENCGNRSLYSSSSHLDKLLNTTSISLLKTTLRLSLRLAQRYHAARMRLAPTALHPTLLASHYNVNLEKVQKLAAPFAKGFSSTMPVFGTPSGKGKEKVSADRRTDSDRFNTANLVGFFAMPEAVVKEELGGVVISYCEPSSVCGEGSSRPISTESPATPTPIRRTSNIGPNQTPRQPRTVSTADSPITPVFPPDRDHEFSRPSGPKVFELSAEQVLKADMHELLKQGLADLPESAHYELLHKLRVTQVLNTGKSGREVLVAIRLLAIANLGYIHGEKEFYQKLGQQDSDEPRRLQLPYQLSELVHPPGNGETGVSRELQTFALNALEALTKHKAKAPDVCAALNVNVNHGVLFYVVRKAVAELGMEEDTHDNLEEDEWREALFSLLNSLPTAQPRTGEGMVSAGLLEILVEVLRLRTKKAERNHPKVLNFLDTFVYNLRDAFSALVSAKGLDIIADLTSYEVETSKAQAEQGNGMPAEYKTQLTDYQIPFHHQQTLRWLFKFMNHMMSHTGGNFDRLMRNLIDSPELLNGLRTVLSSATIFGSTVWSMAVNILTSFIHNEPTSYAVIAEAGLSKAFLETVTQQAIPESDVPAQAGEGGTEAQPAATSQEAPSNPRLIRVYPPRDRPLAQGILPVAEAISTLPPAYGAICLAEAGMKLFKSSPALASFFEIFESPAHIKALDTDPDMPTLIGNSFDELVRHHPQLKTEVLTSLSEMINRVVRLCSTKAEKEGIGAKLWVESEDGRILVAGGRQSLLGPEGPVHEQLSKAPDNAEGDIEMQDADDHTPTTSSNNDVTLDQVVETEDGTDGPTTSQYISVVCRFLGGFFANNLLCASYIESDGVDSILDFATLPCLPYKFNEPHSTSEEVGRVIQLLVEQKPHITVPSILNRAQRALDRLEPLMKHNDKEAFFAPFTNLSASEIKNSPERQEVLKHGTEYAKSLVTVHTLCNALTLTFQAQMFNHRSTHNVFSQVNLADLYAHLVDSLGRLHRSCVWEEILLQKNMPSEWEKETRIKSSGFGTDEADDILRISNNDRTSSESAEGSSNEGSASNQNSNEANGTESSAILSSSRQSQNSVQFKNTQTLRYLLSKVPTGIAPFFQSLGKLLLFRRSLDSYQKQCAVVVADQLAKAAIDQLQFKGPTTSESSEDRYAYWIVILTSMSQLMIDSGLERGYPQALTLVLLSFKNQGGFAVLADILDKFYDSAISVVEMQGEDVKEETQRVLNLSLGGIKIILAFYAHIISSKLINEASQTTSMQSRPDRDRERADFFLAAQFLVELRHAVIRPVQKIWNSELIDKATTSIVKTSISILKTVLDGETEHGAYKRSDKIPKRNKPTIKPWKPRSEDNIKKLKDAGYDAGLVDEAMYRCCDNYNTAKEYCQNQRQNNRALRNPIPDYEIELRKPPSTSPSRAEVVVPEPAETASVSTGGDAGDGAGSEAPDSQSVEMEDVPEEPQDTDPAFNTPVPEVLATGSSSFDWDGPSYIKRANIGNAVDPVTIDDLDEERVNLRKNLIDRSLDILNSHEDVTFELADLISAAVSKASEPTAMRAEIGSTLVQSLISLQGDNFRENGKKIAASAHLLALVIQEKDFYDAIVDELKESFSILLEFIKIFPDQPADEPSPWIGQVLLIVERLLAEDQLPHQVQWTPPTGENQEEMSVDQIPEPIISLDEKNQMFDSIMDVLPRIGKDESLALSIVRVLVMLTRTRKIATRLGEKRNIQRLFLMVRQLAGVTNEGLRSGFMLVLRHIIEDETIIRQFMRSEIQSVLESRNQRQTDTTGYTRQTYHLALRAPEIFVEVTNEKLQLARFDPNQRPQTLVLKREEPTASDADPSAPEGTSNDKPEDSDKAQDPNEPKKVPTLERTKTSDLKPPVVENPDGVTHYLLCELLAYKDIDDKLEPPKEAEKTSDSQDSSQATTGSTSTASGSSSDQTKSEKTEFKADAHPIYIYRCFILRCLAELLQSYNRTKIEFINFSRKADPHATTPSKPRSGVLNYLLSALVPVGTLNHEGDLAFKKKAATSNCAIDVIVSLCAKTGEHGFPKPGSGQASPYVETEPDLLFVRKFVLEHALKAFKDASVSDEALDMKYSRLLSIADIFSKMVSQRSDGTTLSPNAELTPTLKQMAKIMYEKNFITILTTAIADIDLNFPNAKRAVKYILKPLKWLCAVAVDLSTQYDTSSTPSTTEEYEISTASDDDMVGATREDTPDLFRNSTLGMYEPAHESESDPSDDEDDDDMYEDQYADDMEYDEEMPDDDVVSEEDEEMDEMGPIEGLSGDVGMDVEVVIDDDEEDVISGDDESDEDESDEDEDDDDEDMDDIGGMEDVTGDDENASLVDGDEGDWSDDDGNDYPVAPDLDAAGLTSPPPDLNRLMQVLDEHDHVLDQIEGEIEMGVDPDDYLEDEMQEEEDEDEEDDYDEEDIVYNPGIEDDDEGMHGMGWGWDDPAPPVRHTHRINPWMFPGGPNDRILVPAFRSHRPAGGPRTTPDGVNPLLQRSGRSSSGPFAGLRNEGMSDWVHAIEGRGPRVFPADSPVSFISNLLNAMSHGGGLHHHNGALHLSFNNLHLGLPPPFDPTFRREIQRARDHHLSRSAREDPQSAVTFLKQSTGQRWQEEARILYGAGAIEKSQRVINSILKLMVPPAIEAAKKRQAEREAENARKLKEEQERKAQKEREEREAKEKEERERREREAAEAEAQAAEGSAETEAAEASTTAPEGQAMEGVEASQPTAEQSTEAGPSEATPRITTNIRGRELDITGMGIDLEYLEALPEDLREEVLMQQLAEQRSQAAQTGEEPSDISREFLEALPPEIRQELLEQEASERRRREREEARRRSQANGAARAEDMDPASFLASLDPGLRQAVLMEQDEDVLAQLPPEIAVEARALGGDRRLNQFHDYYLPPGYRRGTERRTQQDDQAQKKKARPCVQMLDKAGVATLLRLMFIPQTGSAKASLSHILRNVCENRQNRAEVISILLSILQDGSADVNAVERSFAQLSLRAKQPQQVADKTPRVYTRKTGGTFSMNAEVSPLMVVQQCLHTLWQLTDKNPPVWHFFLTEHETAVGFKSRSNRKGKGKETKATRYPLNGLLGLLDRKLIIESSSIMEQLTTLLRVITGPLQTIKKEKEKAAEETKKKDDAATSSEGQSSSAQATTEPNDSRPEGAQPSEDAEMASAPGTTAEGNTQADGEASASKPAETKEPEDKSKKHRALVPPEVPESNLRLVAKILAARECNSKVFQETLSVISNLSPIPGAKETFGKELLGIAQDLAHSTLKDLANLTVQVSNADSPTDVQGMALSKFSPASSDQAKLLRALTALDYLFDPTRDNKDKAKANSADALEPAQKEDILTTLYENSTFGPLWNKLSECLSVIRRRGNMLNIATILLPLIEALMVVCKNTTLKDAPFSKALPKEFSLSSPPPESRMESLFFTFTEEHRKILNDLVRQNPKLMSGTFSLLVKNSKVLEFDNKRNYFNRRLHSRANDRERHPHPPLQLAVRRDQVFLDSFKSLYFKTADEMKYGKLSIRFHGEEGVDAGGVTREWFQVLSRQMFNADYALFVPVASDRTTFHPNRLSAINGEHLMFFKFIGRIIGKALYEGRVLDCHFSRAVYKRILGKPVNLKDMETLDLEYYKSLVWMLENDITDIITETFSTDVEAFGETKTADLIENGRNIPVTEENKHEYVRLVTEHRLTVSVQEQLENFLKGFHDIVPADLVAIFSEQELELLISGLPDINVDDWKNNTEYHNYTAASPQIQWFWRAVRSFDKEEQAKLLQFVTGTSKVPLNGFKELEGMNGFSRFNIHRDYGSKERLPSSHTCFNQLDLPEYETYEDLRKQLYTAMTAGSEYFGFA
ncbi:E3 ubiquitin-protein ligase HUWE1 [Zopfia rhizophila CBS 207.26]|uniref:HECT-type E3 ubiquitin transferase n=1 Tax=Zopfia rhizophila CBS 207.26 TaxID=1314779 RepID=A0A6A6EHF1_9PEZI|nr:E3 ubiquitin-protein ligase HUWE1 [Zopfia rhizophila CBS 207.26]